MEPLVEEASDLLRLEDKAMTLKRDLNDTLDRIRLLNLNIQNKQAKAIVREVEAPRPIAPNRLAELTTDLDWCLQKNTEINLIIHAMEAVLK